MPPLVIVGGHKQQSGRAGKVQDDNKDDPDPADDPGMPKAIALMLAPCFLILGLVLLWIGKTQGGFLSLILSVVALATGLIKSGRRR